MAGTSLSRLEYAISLRPERFSCPDCLTALGPMFTCIIYSLDLYHQRWCELLESQSEFDRLAIVMRAISSSSFGGKAPFQGISGSAGDRLECGAKTEAFSLLNFNADNAGDKGSAALASSGKTNSLYLKFGAKHGC